MAVNCHSIYTQEESPELYSQFINNMDPKTYASTEWFCFPPGNYRVWNDVMISTEAIMPSINVDMCMNLNEKLPQFDASSCITELTEVQTTMKKIAILTKSVTKYFTPGDYLDSGGKMSYKQASSMTS